MDRLFLLNNEFDDVEMPGKRFFCRDCMLLNGLLSAFPDKAGDLEIIRVEHARPRNAVIEAVGEENQWLPLLVLDRDAPKDCATGEYEGTSFANRLDVILKILHLRHGFPEVHP